MDLIKHVSIEGFKSIKNLDRLELGAINVMIGPNGSGKSNFIGLFQLLNYAMTESFQDYVKTRGFAESFLYLGSKTTSRMRIELEFGTERGTNRYRFTLNAAAEDILIFSEESIFFKADGYPRPIENTLNPGGKESASINSRPSHYRVHILTFLKNERCPQKTLLKITRDSLIGQSIFEEAGVENEA